MATTMKIVESQIAINVSQGHSSPPSKSATPINPKSQGHRPEIQVEASPEPATVQPNESLDKGCIAESLPKDEDLYGVSPRQEARDQARRSSQNPAAARAATDKETTEQPATREHSHSQPDGIVKDALPTLPDIDNGVDEQEDLAGASHSQVRVLTQHSSDLDAIKPGWGNSEPSTKSRSHFQSDTSQSFSPTSPTSAMAPKRKSETGATPYTSTKSGSGRALDALRARNGMPPIERESLSQTKSQSATDTQRDKANGEGQARTALSAKSANVAPSAGRGGGTSKTQATTSSDKPPADASITKRPSRREMMQGEPPEVRGTAAAGASRDASMTNVPEDTDENQKRGRGRPKKSSLANNEKEKKDMRGTATRGEDGSFRVKSYEKTLNSDQADDDDDDDGQPDTGTRHKKTAKDAGDPKQPRPRGKGKGALRSVSKQPSASQGKKREASQHSEYEIDSGDTGDAEDDSYAPPVGGHKAGKLKQVKSKKAERNSGESKSAEPDTKSAVTSRVTRSQMAAASSSGPKQETGFGTKHQPQTEAEAADTPADSTRMSVNVRQTARMSRPAAKQAHEPRKDGDAALDRELQMESRNSLHVSKSKLSAAAPSLEQRETPQVRNAFQPPPGQSQDNAIELSDNDKSSSDDEALDLDPGQQTLAIAQDAPIPAADNRPRQQTPAFLRSTPPTRKGCIITDVQLDIATMQGHKPNIVGWDQHGPRNQGTLIRMTPGTKSTERNRSSLSLTQRSLASMEGPAQGGQGPSSMATSARAGRSARQTPRQSNVAADVVEALVGLDKRQVADTPEILNNADREVLVYEATAHIDEDFNVPMDDVEGDTLVEVNHESNAAPRAAEPRRVRELDRTASQLAMPPPPPARKAAAEANTDGRSVRNNAAQSASAAEIVKNTDGGKRPRSLDEPHGNVSKRVKREEQTANVKSTIFGQEVMDDGTKRRLDDQATHPVANRGKIFSETTHTRGPDVDPVAGNEKQAVMPRAFASKPETRLAHDEAPRRRVSQNSQTVGYGGSPVPADMEVNEPFTVLETYSQEAKETSDIADEIPDRSEQLLSGGIDAERSRNPDVRSSNTKQQPAAPQAGSTVIPRASLRDLEPGKTKLAPQMDPFRGSSKPKDHVVQVASTPEEFHLFGRTLDNDASIKSPQHPYMCKARPSPARSEIPESNHMPLKNSHRDFERLQRAARSSKPVEKEQYDNSDKDPDKTLVNEDERDDLPGVVMDQPEEGYGSPRSLAALDEDLISWCHTLKPHQLDLFDGFVECGRRITHLLAEQENNIARVLTKQHEQGLYVIERDELLRAQDYALAKEALAKAELQSKQDLEESLKEMRKILVERRRNASKRVISTGKREETWSALEEKLERLVV